MSVSITQLLKWDSKDEKNIKDHFIGQASPRKYKFVYRSVFWFSYWHIAALYGLYLCFVSVKWHTMVFAFILYIMADIGVTAGAHRLWCHKAYKATLPLEIILIFFNSIAYQHTALDWVRNHRLHHKYCDTDADPYNATRGFFYAHIGWLLVRKHKDVIEIGKRTDMSDLYSNPVLVFQKKHSWIMIPICFILPTLIPIYLWDETLSNSWHVTNFRYIFSLHSIFLVNSVAHMWGYRPYDKRIRPAENVMVSIMALGEGFHNYHHVFPWDYRAAELGNYRFNLTTLFIDFCAWLGLAYDLKTVSETTICNRKQRTGDPKHVWGWDDEDMTNEEKLDVNILYPSKAKKD